ncbi:MAG: cytochrome C [Nitrospinota bacterium]
MIKGIIGCVVVATFTCCATTMQVPEGDSQAGLLFTRKCSQCHSLPHPKRHTFAQWTNILLFMERLMEQKGVAPLTAKEKKSVSDYLERNSR